MVSAVHATRLRESHFAAPARRGGLSAEQRRDVTGADRFKGIPRGLEAFGRLAGHAGFVVAESRPVIFSDQVLLQPA